MMRQLALEKKLTFFNFYIVQVFTETLTTYSGAGFTPDDRLVVASRYTHLFVWNAQSGAPVRVLQAALSPIVRLFMSPAMNSAVTLLQDNTLQVSIM
jgi:hypothetical protein